jgi:hypothetical protein
MTENNEFALLSDIAKLIKKYGPETFESLAGQMSKPEFTQQMIEILSTTAKVARRAKSDEHQTGSTRIRKDFRSSLIELNETEPEKGTILIQLYDSLSEKRVLPTLRAMQTFTSDNGLPPLKAKLRDKAIVPFVKSFLPIPIEDVKLLVQQLRPALNNDDRSLAGWSDIIFGKADSQKT